MKRTQLGWPAAAAELGVSVELVGETGDAFGAVVVLEEERQAGVDARSRRRSRRGGRPRPIRVHSVARTTTPRGRSRAGCEPSGAGR